MTKKGFWYEKAGIGILTYALNSADTDYEKLAYMMALSYQATNKHPLPLAVIVNDVDNCRPELNDVFEWIIENYEPYTTKKRWAYNTMADIVVETGIAWWMVL